MGLGDMAGNWLFDAPQDDPLSLFQTLLFDADKAGITAESNLTYDEAARYSGLDKVTLKFLVASEVLVANGMPDKPIVFSDLFVMMSTRHTAGNQIAG